MTTAEYWKMNFQLFLKIRTLRQGNMKTPRKYVVVVQQPVDSAFSFHSDAERNWDFSIAFSGGRVKESPICLRSDNWDFAISRIFIGYELIWKILWCISLDELRKMNVRLISLYVCTALCILRFCLCTIPCRLHVVYSNSEIYASKVMTSEEHWYDDTSAHGPVGCWGTYCSAVTILRSQSFGSTIIC